MKLPEGDQAAERTIQTFRNAFPQLSLEVIRRESARQGGVWTAIIRTKEDGRLVATGVRRHRYLAIGWALASVPDMFRRPAKEIPAQRPAAH
jgi:hypothetical protein